MAIITISRGSFAGGKAIAEQVGAQLAYPVVSREELLGDAARDYGIEEGELRSSLNASPPFWRQLPGKRLAYVKCVTAALLDHARDGKLVYHGNVGHLLLTGISHVLRIRVIADPEFRVQSAMEKAGITRESAEIYIRGVDQDRKRWALVLYGVDLESPEQYSAVLHAGQLGLEGAVDTIVGMTKLPAFQPTAESRKRYEDLRLSCRVWAALAQEPRTRDSGIEVTADDGEVVIVGSVLSGEAGLLVPKIAEQVEGVKSVRSEAGVGTHWYW